VVLKLPHIHFTFIILPNDGKGIPWDDHKTIRKLDNSLIIHIRFPDYEAIVNGTNEESRKAIRMKLDKNNLCSPHFFCLPQMDEVKTNF